MHGLQARGQGFRVAGVLENAVHHSLRRSRTASIGAFTPIAQHGEQVVDIDYIVAVQISGAIIWISARSPGIGIENDEEVVDVYDAVVVDIPQALTLVRYAVVVDIRVVDVECTRGSIAGVRVIVVLRYPDKGEVAADGHIPAECVIRLTVGVQELVYLNPLLSGRVLLEVVRGANLLGRRANCILACSDHGLVAFQIERAAETL